MAKTTKQILEDAKALLDTRGWAKRADIESRLTVPKAGQKSWLERTDLPICAGLALLGSVPKEERYRAEHEKAVELVVKEIDGKAIAIWHGKIFDWNDKPKTTRKDVDRVLDAAIAKA